MSYLDLSNDMTPLMCAAACGKIDAMKFLIKEAKVDAFAKNNANHNAYDIAKAMDQKEAIDFLWIEMNEILTYEARKEIVYLKYIGHPIFGPLPHNIFKRIVSYL